MKQSETFGAFGTFLRNIRTEHELEQASVAREAGISKGYLADLESGQRTGCSDKVARRLADALKVPRETMMHQLAKQRLRTIEKKAAAQKAVLSKMRKAS